MEGRRDNAPLDRARKDGILAKPNYQQEKRRKDLAKKKKKEEKQAEKRLRKEAAKNNPEPGDQPPAGDENPS